MKPKTLEFKAFTITEVSRIFGYKTTAVLYRLLNSEKSDEYIYQDISGRIFLRLSQPNQIQLAQEFLKIFNLVDITQ
tara:strand:- start:278 stop:508 length:231 start_codon:yes stop_codon:yes gene_type:complete